MTQITAEELAAGLSDVLAAPKDRGLIDCLCVRPAFNQREFPDHVSLTRAGGIKGERWLTHPWLRLPDGSPDPDIQVSILPKRVLDLVWQDREDTPHPGDTIIADMDLGIANLPEGSLLEVGTAILRVSGQFNEGCVKWKVRYGKAAKDWIVAPGHPELRLRGVLCSVEKDGIVRLTDRVTKLGLARTNP